MTREPSNFNGHTKRQHRASSIKGGKARMRTVTREQQQAWGRKGGLAAQARLRRIRDVIIAEEAARWEDKS